MKNIKSKLWMKTLLLGWTPFHTKLWMEIKCWQVRIGAKPMDICKENEKEKWRWIGPFNLPHPKPPALHSYHYCPLPSVFVFFLLLFPLLLVFLLPHFFFCCHQQYYPKQITTTWSFFPTPSNKDMMTMARTCLTTRGVLIDPPGGWVPSTRQPITFWQWHWWWFQLSPLLLYLQASTKRKRHGKGEKGERKK